MPGMPDLLNRTIDAIRHLSPEQLRVVAEFVEFERHRAAGPAPASDLAAAPPTAGAAAPVVPVAPPVPAMPKKDRADWERFAGENLASRLGIAALVLGVGFFVKYAFDSDLLGPVGRVLLAVAGGAALLLTGHWLRRSVPALASVLQGGGVAVLYLSGTLAFQQYQLLSQPLAFGLMVGVTLLAGTLAVFYDRQELAVVALVGGFAAPLLLATGQARYGALFTYLLILNAGALGLALLRGWRALPRVAWPATALLYGGWIVNQVLGHPQAPTGGPLGFGAALVFLFLLYYGIAFRRAPDPVALPDRLLVVGQAAGAALAGETLLRYEGRAGGQLVLWLGLVVAYATTGLWVRQARGTSSGAHTLLGAAIGLAVVAVPVLTSHLTLTLLWAAQALALLALGLRTRERRLRVAGLVLFGLTLAHLVFIEAWRFSQAERVVAFVVVGALLLGASFLYQKLQQVLTEE